MKTGGGAKMKKCVSVIVLFFLVSIIISGCTVKEKLIKKEEVIKEKEPAYVYLSDMKPIQEEGQLLKDINVEKHELNIGDQTYKRGLCVDSNSEITYRLDNQFKEFRSVIGHHSDSPEYKGKVKFIVYLDGNKSYESGWMKYGEVRSISIPLEDVDKLTLEVEDNGKPTNYAVWVDAKLIEQ